MIVNQANLTGIYKSFSTIFREALFTVKPMWDQVAMRAVSTGRSVDYKWLGAFPNMREWLGDRVVKDLSAYKYEIYNKDFEATVEVDRNDIEDDQIGVYTPMIQGLAHSAAINPDQLVWALLKAGFNTLCYDGQYFFDVDHPVGAGVMSNTGGGAGAPWFLMDLSRPIKPLILQVRKEPQFVAQDKVDDEVVFSRKKFRYGVDDRKDVGFGLWQLAYGSKQTLDTAGYSAGRAAMMGFTDDEGTPLGIVPTHLVVGATNEGAARKILKNERNADGSSNEWFGTAELLVIPWL